MLSLGTGDYVNEVLAQYGHFMRAYSNTVVWIGYSLQDLKQSNKVQRQEPPDTFIWI
jgi:hypothetical protein